MIEESSAERSERRSSTPVRSISFLLSRAADWLALLLAVLTVCALPWLLGGTIPAARLLLIFGSLAATGFCVISAVLAWRSPTGIPLIALLAMGIGGLGLIQMLPLFTSPISGMTNAIYPEFRVDLQNAISERSEVDRTARTLSAADTRMGVAQWLCLSMLVLAGSQTMSSRRRLRVGLALLTLNAVAIAVTGLLQQFGDGRMIFGAHWIRYDSTPFATFTNANNAAGWLCVQLAAAVALMVLTWGPTATLTYSRSFQKPSLQDRFWHLMEIFQSRLARLNNAQILASSALIVLLVGILATLSRAGILAAFSGVLVGVICRMPRRNAILVGIPFLLLVTACVFVLRVFEMDEVVLTELSTLQNSVSETEARMQHWRYVLTALFDFPLLGLGLNSYRFSTLPYIGRSHEKWFHHADNQFVEFAVETGVPGFLLFSGIWLALIIAGLRLSRYVKDASGRDRTWLLALTLLAIIVSSSQVLAGCFDYGCGLPATSAAVMLLAGAVVSPMMATGSSLGIRPDEMSYLRSLLFWSRSRLLTVSLQVSLAAAAICFVPDLIAAHRIHEQVLAVERALKNPVSQSKLSALAQLEQDLTRELLRRPDDADGLKAMTDLMEARFRNAIMTAVDDVAELPDAEFARAWRLLTPTGIANRILDIQNADGEQLAEQLRGLAARSLAEYPWNDHAHETRQRIPLMPGLAVDLLCAELLSQSKGLDESLVRQTVFNEPGNGRRLFQAGYFCLRRDRNDLAELAWTCSLKASERFRAEILTAAVQHWSPQEAIDRFGITGFASTVQTASGISDQQVRDLLWVQADKQWQQLDGKYTAEECYQRAIQMQQTQGDDAALEWLNNCFERFPEDLNLSMLSATLLEKQGKVREAIGQWSRIQYYHPRSKAADKAIKRLDRQL